MGSLEVLEELITQNQPSEFQLKIIKSEVGNVTINDIDLALSTKGKLVHCYRAICNIAIIWQPFHFKTF